MADWTSMTGWKFTRRHWPAWECTNCNTVPSDGDKPIAALSIEPIAPTKLTTPTFATKDAAEPNDLFACCFYSDPSHSYIQPMEGQGYNPQFHATCPGRDTGLTLFGTWHMDSMYDCIAFGPYQ